MAACGGSPEFDRQYGATALWVLAYSMSLRLSSFRLHARKLREAGTVLREPRVALGPPNGIESGAVVATSRATYFGLER
jgi:hypothetical protein